MKWLKYLGIGLLALIVLICIVAIFAPKTFEYSKSIDVNAPIDSVWKNTSTLAAMDKWSPWNDHDPAMKKQWSGVGGTVGAKQSWEGEVVGSGSQTISKVVKPILLETNLDFLKPHESHGKAYVSLESHANVTRVTWGMTGKMPYPMNILILFMDMEKQMGADWDRGLGRLKKMSEHGN